MTREEKANKLGQEYFPDESNIWARPNYEAKWVAEACIKMAEWEHKRLVEKACEWLYDNWKGEDFYITDIIEGLRKAMEEK